MWLPGFTHDTFKMTSITWTLTYSDWFSSVEGALNGWLFLPNLTFAMPIALYLLLVISVTRLVFVAVVFLHRECGVDESILIVVGILLSGISVVGCAYSMTANVIYGIPPGGPLLSIRAPDFDARLFVPTPILLVAGLLLSKKQNSSDVEA